MSIKLKMLTLLAAVASIGGLAFAAQSQAAYVDTTPDCDKFAVVHCGTKDLTEIRRQYDSRNTNGSNGSTTRQNDIPAIFSAMGISRSDLEGRNSQFTFGVIYKDGRIVVNGKTVAKNAMIAGRHMGGSAISGSSTAKVVSPSKMASAQRVVVKFNDKGQFDWAVATPCGNPIRATNTVPAPPQPKPVASCDSLAQPVITKRTNVALSSAASVKNGATIKSHVFTLHDKSGKQINQRVVTTSAKTAKTSMQLTTPGTYTAKVVIVTSLGNKTSANCEKRFTIDKPTPPTPPKPVYACEQITKKEISRTSYDFGARSSSKNGATASGFTFNFGDGNTKTVGPSAGLTRHTYAKAGTYKVTVTALFKVNGKTVKANAPACETTVTVKEEPKKPVYSCDQLTDNQISRTKFSFNSQITAKNGASVKSRTFDYGDGNTETKPATGAVEHTYAKAGTYTVKLTANISVNGKTVPTTSAACETKVTVKEADKPGVAIVKTVNGVEHEVVEVDEEFNYEIKVTNTGNVDLKDAVVTDNAPKGVTFKSADKGEIKDNKWSYTIPTLKVGESAGFNIKAVVAEYLPGTIVNNACVETPTVPGEEPCDDATVEVPPKKEEETVERCDTETNEIVSGLTKEEAADDKYTTDYSQCEEKPVTPETPEKPAPETPAELPETGLTGTISAVLGLGSLTAATYYYVASRRL